MTLFKVVCILRNIERNDLPLKRSIAADNSAFTVKKFTFVISSLDEFLLRQIIEDLFVKKHFHFVSFYCVHI